MKPCILLIPDRTLWIIGDIAKKIIEFNNEFQFITISRNFIWRHHSIYKKLISNVDLVHLLTPYNNAKLLNCAQCPTITTLHHCTTENIKNISGIEHNDKIIVVATEWRNFLINLGCPKSKIEVVPNGVSSDFFVPNRQLKAERQSRQHGSNNKKFTIGYFGKETRDRRKGSDTLIETFHLLNDYSQIHRFKIVLSGFPDQKLLSELSKLNVSVVNLGYLESKESLLAAYQMLDCYIITSRIEGGPCTLLEAMSCEIPVISTPVGMAKDYIKDRKNGMLVPIDRPDLMRDALIELSKNSTLRTKIANKARELITDQLTWKKTIPVLSKIYMDILGKTKKNKFSKKQIQWIENETIFLDKLGWIKELKYLKNSKLEKEWHYKIIKQWPYKSAGWLSLLRSYLQVLKK